MKGDREDMRRWLEQLDARDGYVNLRCRRCGVLLSILLSGAVWLSIGYVVWRF